MVAEVLQIYAPSLAPDWAAPGLTVDEEALLRAGGLDPTPRDLGAKDPFARTLAEHTAILERSLGTAAVARRLGVSEVRVRQRIAEHSLLAAQVGRGWRLPAFQFGPEGELPGWAAVCRAIPADANLVAVFHWLDLPHPDLDDGALTPRQWLSSGRDPAAVVALAPAVAPA